MGKVVLYGDAIGFPINKRDAPKEIFGKAQEIAKYKFSSLSKEDSESIVSAELIIVSDINLEKCTYQLTVYCCEEDRDLQQVDYDIKPGTDLYFEFKKYALKVLEETLFPI